MILTDFIEEPKSLMIAPAGHGKTHAIAECVRMSPDNSIQLILTHTHAGVSSIKSKLQKLGVENKRFEVNTITGFSQGIVSAYIGLNRLGTTQEDPEYFNIVLQKCLSILRLPSVMSVMNISYQGLFVDEYQDCSQLQNQIINLLAESIPTHLFGDMLQSIYDFNGKRVDFETDLVGFKSFDMLTIPWRWRINGNCLKLGDKILSIRKDILCGNTSYTLETDKDAHFYVCKIPQKKDGSYYSKVGFFLRKLSSPSILVIVPTYFDSNTGALKGNADDRAAIRKQFNISHIYNLIEAIDDKSFYAAAKDVDNIIDTICRSQKKIKKVYDFLVSLKMNKTDLNFWIDSKKNRIKGRRAPHDKNSESLKQLVNSFTNNPNITEFLRILTFVSTELKITSKRPELQSSIKKSMLDSIDNKKSVYQNMCDYKNKIRIVGRKVEGRCIGTTLLTKGLEFDDVVILDAQNIPDVRNFYVAISRACKNLYILTDRNTLTFNP